VVTEYHYHAADDFAIEVEYFSMPALTNQLRNLLQSYRNFHLYEDRLDRDEREDKEKLARVAKDTFDAMFPGRMRDESFLLGDSEQDVLQTLTSWLEDVYPRAGGRADGLTLTACGSTLAQLSSQSSRPGDPAAWPFIRKIKFVSIILTEPLVANSRYQSFP